MSPKSSPSRLNKRRLPLEGGRRNNRGTRQRQAVKKKPTERAMTRPRTMREYRTRRSPRARLAVLWMLQLLQVESQIGSRTALRTSRSSHRV
jgi:hypothetical protein